MVGLHNGTEIVDMVPPGHTIMGLLLNDSGTYIKDGGNPVSEANVLSFTGQLTRFRSIELTGVMEILYIVFQPCGSFQLLGIGQQHCTDKSENLADMLPAAVTKDLRCRLEDARTPGAARDIAEAFLLRQLFSRKIHPNSHRIAQVARLLARRADEPGLIRKICREEGFSKSTLDRQVKEMIGVTPKQFQLIIRFNAVLNFIRQQPPVRDWTRVAHHFGYYDQAHFIRDFRHFYGKLPSRYSSSDELLSNIVHE